jgi:asparagine synthetase B (glutamine-hydrolysing)
LKKRYKNSVKPFWNDTLTKLWKDLCLAQKYYLSFPQFSHERRVAFRNYKDKQYIFDKTYSKTKRKFQREKMMQIEKLNTNNPREFWNELKKLGPRKKVDIPLEVYGNNGEIITDVHSVLSKWSSEYEKLFKGYDKIQFDYVHYNQILHDLDILENNPAVSPEINFPISLREVQATLKKAKVNKAVGQPPLPNFKK